MGKKNAIIGYLAGAIAAACYGMNPLFALPLYQGGMGTYSVLFWRYFFALIFVALMMKGKGLSFQIRRREILPLLGMGVTFTLSSISLFESYNYIDAGIATTILFMYPVLTAIIMATFFHEKASWTTIASIVIAFVGIALLTLKPGGGMLSLAGIMLVVMSSLSYAIYIVATNQSFLKYFPSLKLTFYALLAGLFMYLIPLKGGAELQIPQNLMEWGCEVGLAFFPTVISMVGIAISIHHIGSTPASILGALEPVTALGIGVLVFHESFTGTIALGLVLVLVGVTIIVLKPAKSSL